MTNKEYEEKIASLESENKLLIFLNIVFIIGNKLIRCFPSTK